MGVEIERKFLVDTLLPIAGTTYQRFRQGYLNLDIDRTVRVRLVDDGLALITIKGRNEGAKRNEYEYEIPVEDAEELLEMCIGGFVEKFRYYIPHNELTIEFDIFNGANGGLIIAEIEFDENDPMVELSEGEIQHHLPEWIGKEVTNDPRYFNSSLIKNPFKTWSK